jgi:cystathionine beta-lyase
MLNERYSAGQVDAFVDALKLFRIGYSWAGPQSLVVPYDIRSMRDAAAIARSPHLQGHLVRFSVGLEAACDLQDDLAQAMALALG